MNRYGKAFSFGALIALALAATAALVSCAGGPAATTEETNSRKGLSGAAAGAGVAIFDFELKGGGAAYEGLKSEAALAIAEALVKGGVLKPVERSQLEKALAEQELALSGLVDDATAARVGRLSGARYALLGSLSILGDQARLSCRLIDVETAEIVFAESVVGEAKNVFELADELAGTVEDEFSK